LQPVADHGDRGLAPNERRELARQVPLNLHGAVTKQKCGPRHSKTQGATRLLSGCLLVTGPSKGRRQRL
jgi:hypothetical protein